MRGEKMASETRRKHPRHIGHIPILYAGYDSESYDKATMLNSCSGGMYFKSDSPIQPGCDLHIKIQDQLRERYNPDQHKAFRAKVKWCRQVTDDRATYYGIGVQYTDKSRLSYCVNSANSDCLCDFCENQISIRSIHRTETGLQLCPECLQFMEKLPDPIEEAVERFLMGNVV